MLFYSKWAELTNAVKENKGIVGLDQEKLLADFGDVLEKQRIAAASDAPNRLGDAPYASVEEKAVDTYQGKYRHEVKSIYRDGFHQVGNWKLRGADLLLQRP